MRANVGERTTRPRDIAVGLRLQLEQLIAQSCCQLEVEVRGRFAHLALESLHRRGAILITVRRRPLGDPPLIALALFAPFPRVGDAGDEAHLLDALLDATRYDTVRLVMQPLR